jgi:hypothetical protein
MDKRYNESLRLVMDIFDAEKAKNVQFEDRLAAAEARASRRPKAEKTGVRENSGVEELLDWGAGRKSERR